MNTNRTYWARRRLASAVVMLAAALTACRSDSEPQLDLEQIQAVTEEAYIFSFPVLEQYKMLFALALYPESGAYEGPPNAIVSNSDLLGPDYTLIVRPNNDTFYSGAWLDLRAEPMVLSVPPVPLERYYSFQLIDLYTHNFAYVGSRATGPETGNYLIAGPGWAGDVPEGIDGVLRSESAFVAALGRTAVFGPEDVAEAREVQSRYDIQPLSSFAGTDTPPTPDPPSLPPYSADGASSPGFVTLLNAFLPFLEVHSSEVAVWERYRAIGIGDPTFDIEGLAPDVRGAMDAGIAAARQRIQKESTSLGQRQNGWQLTDDSFGTREAMQGRYLRRAGAALFGLWGNDLEEAFYPEAVIDGDDEALDGSRHQYVLSFEPDELPPCRGFWSISMYKLPEQLFIHNPIGRYSIGDRTPGLEYGDDGSLTIYFGNAPPATGVETNWLPAPEGPFSLQMRCYWPEPEALDPLYAPPAVEKVR